MSAQPVAPCSQSSSRYDSAAAQALPTIAQEAASDATIRREAREGRRASTAIHGQIGYPIFPADPLRTRGVMDRSHPRRQALCGALEQPFLGTIDMRILGASAGLHIVAAFADIPFTPALLEKLQDAGVRVYPVEEHAVRPGRHAE
ncbi:hypothetical protein [Brevibacillus nitrificans]|uniref:hypothetical protein n=1 Tax=Brevibacillus nitrificans TaxID=651560 RepID=UPI0016069039|nr:hypothetical protein [Brevibacillus nitrificans]